MNKVIIIEDDPIVAHIYRTRLEKEGYAVETCADGQAGFYRIHEFNPDAVLLDLMLPKMNGVDILKKIRAQSKFGRVPIVVFTNAYVPNMIQEAFSAGASQVFNKATITPRQILDALHVLLYAPTGDANPALPGPQPSQPGAGAAANRAAGQNSPLSCLSEPSFHAPQRPTGPPASSPYPYQNHGYSPEMLGQPGGASKAPFTAVAGFNADDAAFQSELHHAFVASKPEILAILRKLLQDFIKAPDEKSRMPHLLELYRKVHSLTGSAGIVGFNSIAQMTAALEVLLKELYEKPKNTNASTLRTVAHSIDFLGELFRLSEPDAGDASAANIMVVDDEILSRRAITYALEKANLKAINLEDPNQALKMASENPFDLIFLDVQMPGMDGFELCTKIRAGAVNRTTPIIFVTSLTDFKSRAKSSLSGGTDLIAKPFMFIELTVKALTHVLRSQLSQRLKAA